MKRIALLLLTIFPLMCHAARQEDNISQMIIYLYHELDEKWNNIQVYREANARHLVSLDSILNNCNDNSRQCAMTVYSTDDDVFQDVAFANQNTAHQYESFVNVTAPYTSMLDRFKHEVLRQDSLMKELTHIDTKRLTPYSRTLLPKTISLLTSIQQYDRQILCRLQKMQPIYSEAANRLETLHNVCSQKYRIISSDVFYDFSGNIFDLCSDWRGYVRRMEESRQHMAFDDGFSDDIKKYGLWKATMDVKKVKHSSHSSWGLTRVVVMTIASTTLFFRALLCALFIVIVMLSVRKACALKYWTGKSQRVQDAVSKTRGYLSHFNMKKVFVLFTVWLNALQWCRLYVDVVIRKDGSMMDALPLYIFYFAMLVAVMLTFFMLRYSGRRFWRSLAVSVPVILAFLYALTSLIMVMPDDEIFVETPILTSLFFIMQLVIYMACHKYLDRLMTRISHLNTFFLGLVVVIAFIGLQFLSTIVVAFWCSFMVCFMLLMSLKQYLDIMVRKYGLYNRSVKCICMLNVLYHVIYPMSWIYAVLLSLKMGCSIYSLDDFFHNLLHTDLDTRLGNITVNLNQVIFICWCLLLASCISRVISKSVEFYHKSKGVEHMRESSLFNFSVLRILVWCLALVCIMLHMGFNLHWVGLSFAGIVTGLGIASQRLFENFIYGLTLRNGQLKVGNWVICEGIRGQIKNVGLLSTRMESVDGSVITITNSRLVNLSYQNITINHGYELLHTAFSVNFGEDIDEIRNILITGYSKYDCYDKNRPIEVFIKDINNDQIDLDFCVWVPASDRDKMVSFNHEYVYNILKHHGIAEPED